MAKQILNKLTKFEKIQNLNKHIVVLTYELKELIKKRNNTIKLLNHCYEDYFRYLFSFNSNLNETINKETIYIHRVNDFKNLLALINVIDSIEEKDNLFINLIESINTEIDKDDLKKEWNEIKNYLNKYWNNTKDDIERYRKRTILWRNELEILFKKLHEYNPN